MVLRHRLGARPRSPARRISRQILVGSHVGAPLHVYGLSPRELTAAVGAGIAAAALGSAVLFLPGGLGAREGLLYSYLVTIVGPVAGTTVALLGRVLTLLVDVLLGAVGAMALPVVTTTIAARQPDAPDYEPNVAAQP